MKILLYIALVLILVIVTLFDGIDQIVVDFLSPLGNFAYLVMFLICLFIVGLFLLLIKWLKI